MPSVHFIKKNLCFNFHLKTNHPTGVSTFANRYKPIPRPKFAKELPPLPPEKNYFLKFPSLLKIFKTATAQPPHKDQNTNLTMTAKPLSEVTFTKRTTERQLVTWVTVAQLIFKLNLYGLKAKIGLIRSDLSDAK